MNWPEAVFAYRSSPAHRPAGFVATRPDWTNFPEVEPYIRQSKLTALAQEWERRADLFTDDAVGKAIAAALREAAEELEGAGV